MSLVKKHALTARKLSANRQNGRRSRGAVTLEGKRRAAVANLRHGFYSQRWEEVMLALGEDPREFQELLDSLVDTWQPANGYELALVKRLARILWRMERSDRIQESVGLRRVEQADESQALLGRVALAEGAKKLPPAKALAASVVRPDFVTRDSDLKLFAQIYGDNPKNRVAVEILNLLHLLRRPPDEDSPAAAAGLEPVPGAPAAQDGPREQARHQLLELLSGQVQLFEKGLALSPEDFKLLISPRKRAALLAPEGPSAALMLRMEDSGLRQAWRITNLLVKTKKAVSEVHEW
jgi:hypothetical protein